MNVLDMKLNEVDLDENYLAKMGDYYNSDFVKKNAPHIRQIPFFDWVKKDLREKGCVLKIS